MPCADSPRADLSAPALTVLLATHNGARTLPRVLRAYESLQPPAGGWNVVVVDNASTDDTPSVLAEFKQRLPLTALHTDRRGKNVALNIGLGSVRADLVVLTDDDAIPDADWLVAMQAAAAAAPSFDVFAGRIDPLWPEGTPPWIERLVPLGATYAITPAGVAEGAISAAQVWGPNMAVRRSVFDAGHRFDEAVGPQAGQYVMGSEVEFTCRVERLGHRAWYAAGPRVQHIIRPNQIDRAWIVQRAYRLGRHMYHQERLSFAADLPLIQGAPRWKHRLLVEQRLKRWWHGITGRFEPRFLAEWEVSFLRGYIDEAARHVATP